MNSGDASAQIGPIDLELLEVSIISLDVLSILPRTSCLKLKTRLFIIIVHFGELVLIDVGLIIGTPTIIVAANSRNMGRKRPPRRCQVFAGRTYWPSRGKQSHSRFKMICRVNDILLCSVCLCYAKLVYGRCFHLFFISSRRTRSLYVDLYRLGDCTHA